MTDDEANKMLEALQEHFGVPVRPVTEYCSALEDWIRVCGQANDEWQALPKEERGWRSPPPLHEIVDSLPMMIQLDVYKSNYLHRRIYLGEPHRTEPCPVHKGHWSGCAWPGEACKLCVSNDGTNITGWLRPELVGAHGE